MKTRKKDWFGKSDVGIYSEMRVRRFGREARAVQRRLPMGLSAETEVTGGVRGGPIHVVPTGAALGATVKGVDLKDLKDVAFARIMQAWRDHLVLLFRDQTLSDHELMAFSRRLGDLDWG